MGGKGKGKRRSSKTQGAKPAGEAKKKPAKRASGRRSGRSGKSRCNVDIFSEAAMENAYYICHNIQDVLKCRGFAWPDAQKKKKGKKGKK